MRTILATISCLASVLLAVVSPAYGAPLDFYSFKTTAEFVATCDVAEPPGDCMAAVEHVEEVVDSRDHPNDTCDGGPEAMLKAGRAGESLDDWLLERVVRIIPWLKAHPEYDDKSYGDGIWAALKGVYCG